VTLTGTSDLILNYTLSQPGRNKDLLLQFAVPGTHSRPKQRWKIFPDKSNVTTNSITKTQRRFHMKADV